MSIAERRQLKTDEEEIVPHKKALVIAAVALSVVVLAGFVSASLTAEEAVKQHHPNDRANHHPKHPTH
jgi:Flp pilus assembly protein CpaB